MIELTTMWKLQPSPSGMLWTNVVQDQGWLGHYGGNQFLELIFAIHFTLAFWGGLLTHPGSLWQTANYGMPGIVFSQIQMVVQGMLHFVWALSWMKQNCCTNNLLKLRRNVIVFKMVHKFFNFIGSLFGYVSPKMIFIQ